MQNAWGKTLHFIKNACHVAMITQNDTFINNIDKVLLSCLLVSLPHHYYYHYHLFNCLVKIKREGLIKFTIMARRPQETTRLTTEATSAVINK